MAPKGYKKAEKSKIKRLILSVEGCEKEGKTTFGLSAPGPICLINMDIGLEGVVDKVLEEKVVYVHEFNHQDATNTKEWTTMWNEVKRAYLEALSAPVEEVRTLVVDTETETWELIRLAKLGKLSQILPHQYGPVNAEYRDLIRKAYIHNKNVVFVSKMKDEYVKDVYTGNQIRSGFKDIPYLMQLGVRVYRDQKQKMFGAKVLYCRHNPDIQGREYPEPLVSFGMLAQEAWVGSSEEDWS